MNRLVQQGGQQWGEKLVFHRKLMNAEMKKNLQRLAYLAEERHVQYKKEFIEDRRQRIAANHQKMEAEKQQIKKELAEKKKSLFLLDMGFEKARQQQVEQKAERKRLAKLKREKMEAIETKARREWLVEMNDKCMLWNRTPDEMQYAKYRLFNKAILTRLPRNRNLILDRHAEIENAVEQFDDNGKKIDYDALLETLKAELAAEGKDVGQLNKLYDPALVAAKEAKLREEEEALSIKTEKDKDNEDDVDDEQDLAALEENLELDEESDGNVDKLELPAAASEENNSETTTTATTPTTEDIKLESLNLETFAAATSEPTSISDEYDIGKDVIERESSGVTAVESAPEINDNELAELEAEFLKQLETLPTNKMINVLESELKEKFTDARKQEELDIVKQMLQDKKPSNLDSKIVDISNNNNNNNNSNNNN
ncbi:hypothetical protein PPL_04120 [Heterostelium album PN500]|uniref:Uncharacterized protein n=1 Tax=Heterostelium pallidum (strain ATCC 26659 / Pp 5 / PN500) TaxID=670386 RepID=D3B629_HETP5|nr:hypothetical protein PPL_04120 [Heterostelium album PN500]EFA83327.1 hypothetical protein PPL_04120 [Heterostelium album PN500]|eukprot:XP_020435444.1 hypothetical protein PPL_04120 [Heterostelium album PN500]